MPSCKYGLYTRSQALRGNALPDAPRPNHRQISRTSNNAQDKGVTPNLTLPERWRAANKFGVTPFTATPNLHLTSGSFILHL